MRYPRRCEHYYSFESDSLPGDVARYRVHGSWWTSTQKFDAPTIAIAYYSAYHQTTRTIVNVTRAIISATQIYDSRYRRGGDRKPSSPEFYHASDLQSADRLSKRLARSLSSSKRRSACNLEPTWVYTRVVRVVRLLV